MSKSRVLCAFCGLRRDRAREDLISKWMVPIIGGHPPYFSTDRRVFGTEVLTERRRRVGSAAAYKYLDVCKVCNNGWMSQLENEAKPLLIPLLNGEHVAFSAEPVETIATWCFLKAVVYDAWTAGVGLVERAFGTEFLFANRSSPRDAQVLLGAFQPPPGSASLSMFRRELVGGGSGIKMTRVSFAFKHLVIAVHLIAANPGSRVVHATRMFRQERLVEIWPSVRPLDWLPNFEFDQGTFDELFHDSPIEMLVSESRPDQPSN